MASPVCRFINGRYWHHGRGFKTREEVIDSLSDKDIRRGIDWERSSRTVLRDARMMYRVETGLAVAQRPKPEDNT